MVAKKSNNTTPGQRLTALVPNGIALLYQPIPTVLAYKVAVPNASTLKELESYINVAIVVASARTLTFPVDHFHLQITPAPYHIHPYTARLFPRPGLLFGAGGVGYLQVAS